jgi:hypothetical protein
MISVRPRALGILAAVLLLGAGAVIDIERSQAAPPATGAAQAAPEHPEPEAPVIAGGPLDTDCSHGAGGLGGPGYQFIATCPGRSTSPDGRFAVVQEDGEQGGVSLQDRAGKLLDDIPGLADGMPFVLFWSPRSDWFFANHYLGSGQERLRVFQIVNGSAIERSAMFAAARRAMVRRYPCLGRGASIVASGWRWSRDGRRIAMVVYARPDACGQRDQQGVWQIGPAWDPLWMIGDIETGRIDPASVRERDNGVGPMPEDGPYARL